jgi:hypothetical protein
MKHLKLPILGLSLAILGAGTFATLRTAEGTSPQQATTNLGSVPVRLVFAQPYRVVEPYRFAWMHEKDAPMVEGGWIIAVASDPEIVDVRQTHDELLFVGDTPVERVNVGLESGILVGFVPSPLDAQGQPTLDLGSTPIYWAKPEILPEALRTADAQAVLKDAVARGAAPQTQAAVVEARTQGGQTVDVGTLGDLFEYSAVLLKRYAPEEVDLISGLTAPRVK